MNTSNTTQTSRRNPHRSIKLRAHWFGPLFAGVAVFVVLLLASYGVHAQTPVLKFTFEDAPGTTTANVESTPVVLTNFDKSTTLTPADLHGLPGSGVSGQIDNNRALVLTNASYVTSGGVYGPGAYVANSSTLANGLGNTITAFTATEWFKGTVLPPVNALLGRMFVLGPTTVNGDINTANFIGMKWQQPNQWNVSIGTGNPTATAIFPASLPINQWLFMAIVYDGTNVMIYQGTDTAAANLISSTPAPGLTTSLGSSAGLYIGNRNTRQRAYVGWVDDFRFYTNASSALAVEGIRQEAAGGGPIATGFYPDGLMLQQATNKFVFNAISPSGVWGPSVNITNIQMTLNGIDVSSQLAFVTNGSAANISVSFTGLPKDQTNTVVMTVQDANGKIGTSSVIFDTFSPSNFVWEAEEFDHDSGQFIDNADYTSFATNTSYFGLDSTESIDTHKGTPGTGFNASDYRAGGQDGTRTQTPAGTDLPRQRFLNLVAAGDTAVVDHVVGNWSSGEWQNYTRTFPAGNYNIYARMSANPSGTLTMAQVTSGRGTSGQTTVNLGTFAATGNALTSYQWVPLKNSLGNLAVVNLGGVNAVRLTSGGGANANFYMLVPANTNLPSISGLYPNGQVLFQATNRLVFTASSAVTTINTNSISLTLNGANVSSSLVFSGGPATWSVSYTGLNVNQSYSAVISVTDANGSTATSTFKFDTWNPVFQVEAEDFDFNGGQYIDNAAPTTGPAANSYFGQVGTIGIDESVNGGNPPYAGASAENYRNSDAIATTKLTAAEAARQQFVTAGAADYNVGFLGPFFWQNYTRTWPTGTFNIYGRMASGANIVGGVHMAFDEVTGGWGTPAQFTRPIGSFTVPTTNGYSSYLYVPLRDQFGNYANVTLGGTNTFRTTFARSFATRYPAEFGLNINFYMLVAARTDLARIDGVYPDGSILSQPTNKLSFVASSPNYGINTTNIHVTLNGVDISTNLVFTGSAASWNVSYPGLLRNQSYTAVITVTDANNQTTTATVNFTTFNPNNFTWEAEDFDFDPGSSPVNPDPTGKRYIDNPAPTSSPAANSYFGQSSALGIDVGTIFGDTHPGTYIYRSADWISTEVTSDASRQKYLDAQQAALDPTIADYDINWLTNTFINYTRTFPTGSFYLYGRLSAGNGAFNLQCGQVTGGWGTTTPTAQYLGTFTGTGASFATWQWVPLVNTNTGLPVVLSLGGTNTFQMTGDFNENANFFMLVPVPQRVSLAASLSQGNILLSFPTQQGVNYQVEYKSALPGANWTPLTSVTGDGTTQVVRDPNNLATRFYRLNIQ
jgi:hypothetical protein